MRGRQERGGRGGGVRNILYKFPMKRSETRRKGREMGKNPRESNMYAYEEGERRERGGSREEN